MLETNGTVLGHRPDLCARLARSAGGRSGRVQVRICVKGTSPDSFETVTGCHGAAFYLQLQALQTLSGLGVSVRMAFMPELFAPADVEDLVCSTLADWGLARDYCEYEALERYPPVMRRLRQRGMEVEARV